MHYKLVTSCTHWLCEYRQITRCTQYTIPAKHMCTYMDYMYVHLRLQAILYKIYTVSMYVHASYILRSVYIQANKLYKYTRADSYMFS